MNSPASPTISIIIPSFNQGQFIGQTIDSILQQKYPKVEIIVCDGGSTDSTVQVLKSYGKKIWWVSEKDKGQTDAINKGIRKATGEIFAYLNSDDYLLPGALATIAQEFAKKPESLWLTGDYVIVGETGQKRDSAIVLYKSLQRQVMKYLPFLQKLILGINNPIIQPSTFWRHELLEQIGPFKEDLRYTMDYDWWWRAWKIQPPLFLSQRLSAFRIHGASKGGTQYEKQMAEQLEVARSHGVHSLVLFLQRLHNSLIIWWYNRTK